MTDRTPLRRVALRTTGRRPPWARLSARVRARLRARGGSDLPRHLAGVAILAALVAFGLSRLAPDPRAPEPPRPSPPRTAMPGAPPPESVRPAQPAPPPAPEPSPRSVAPAATRPATLSPPPGEPADARQTALDRILLEDFDWQKDTFGAVASATFRIRNTAGRDARDIAIACVYFTPEGAVAGTRLRQTYEQVRAGESLVVRDLSMGLIPEGARRVACEVRDAVLE